jgi:predicted RNA binding protein YcfA (HicA-like mRNA interferase family)
MHWKKLVKLCEGEGCLLDREKGDHYIMTKPGLARPVVIPKKHDLREDIVLSVGKTLGLDRNAIEQKVNPKRVRSKPRQPIPPESKPETPVQPTAKVDPGQP